MMLKGSIALALALAASAAHAQASDQRCAAFTAKDVGARDLGAKSLEDSITITAATHEPATAARPAPGGNGSPPVALPAHCTIDGTINDRTGANGKHYAIGFSIALPDDWNGRFLLMGGGGLNGAVNPPIGPIAAGNQPALARGFAVISHDSGHKGAVFDRSFMEDQRANLDFSESSVRTVALLGKAITARYYGKAASRSYMTGCSTGGREGMLASQRYPELFDGIIVGAPAMRTGNSNLGLNYAQVLFNQAAPRDAKGLPLVERLFSDADRATLAKGLLGQCDALDGLKDGMIMNVGQCKFQPAKLLCKTGQKTDCLSKAQVTALDKAFAGPKDKAGYPLYAAVPFDTGITETKGPLPGYLPTGKPGILGPVNRDLTIDLDARIEALRADAGQRLTDTNVWTNLNGFTGHGGKILFYHGVSDPWFSALDTLDYWHRAEKANGAAWADTSRFYMVPGMGHCGGGNAFDRFDLLSALVDWVEQGKAPGTIVAERGTSAIGGAAPAARPMCAFPGYAKYVGGDESKAGSFVCAAGE